MTTEMIKEIEEKIGYSFSTKELLIEAFTRKFFESEHQGWICNEGLEFVGDKVLDIVVVKKLVELYCSFNQDYMQSYDSIKRGEKVSVDNAAETLVESVRFEFLRTEGELTELKKQVVQTLYLSGIVEELGIADYLIMGRGDELKGVNHQPHVMEDLFEAIVGAIAIDSSWNMPLLEEVIAKLLKLDVVLKEGVPDATDFISLLQNWYVSEYGVEPEYRFSDTDIEETFSCVLDIPGIDAFWGFGYSKQSARRAAARKAWEHISKVEANRKTLLDEIGEFDLDTAVGKLISLSDKKLIGGLEFIFAEGEKGGNGNPIWSCECRVDGVDALVKYSDEKKIKAKKYAAYTMLDILVNGRDHIMEAIVESLNI